jgi:hypothetical protein
VRLALESQLLGAIHITLEGKPHSAGTANAQCALFLHLITADCAPRPTLPGNAHDAFLRYVLDKAVRLAYLERVRKDLPDSFVSHLPPKLKGSAAWAPLGEGAVAEPGSMAAKSAALLNRLRTKAEQV